MVRRVNLQLFANDLFLSKIGNQDRDLLWQDAPTQHEEREADGQLGLIVVGLGSAHVKLVLPAFVCFVLAQLVVQEEHRLGHEVQRLVVVHDGQVVLELGIDIVQEGGELRPHPGLA